MATEKQNPHIREHGFHLQGPDLGPTEEELAELARLGERFPRYYIFRHVTAERGVRYLAHRAAIEARQHVHRGVERRRVPGAGSRTNK